ncbi:MAG: carboxypeptidase-like regulatory domain-containing protein [Bryobacteraceae bacterium]
MSFVRLAVFLLCAAASVWAQGTAQIHGTVQDSSGAAVPGAEVKAVQTDTGATRTANTGADGGYILTTLPIGPYRIEVSKEGFTKAVQTGVTLQVATDPAIDIALKVGAVTEQVNVEANAALIETRSSGIGEVVQNQRIVELPLNGRNVTDLVNLAGAAVTFGTSQSRWFGGLPNISMGGQLFYATDYSLDGADHTNFLSGTTMPIAFPDAVQEFKAESSGQTAQRGRAAAVSVVTKSGTNDIHGDAFEFIRNDGFGVARDYFATTKDSLKRHQFGGVIGGAIIKNKLFAFGGFQGTTLRQLAANSTATIPTARMLNGDFSGCANFNASAIGTTAGVTGASSLDPAQFSPVSKFLLNKMLPTINAATGPCGQITYAGTNNPANGYPLYQNDKQMVGRVDYQINDGHSAFFRLVNTLVNVPVTSTLNSNMLAAGGNGSDQFAQSYAIGDTYVLSPTMVNSARIAFNRTANRLSSTNLFTLCDAGVKIYCGGATPGQLGQVNVVGFFQLSTGLGDGDAWRGYSLAFNDDVNWIRGSHQMTFGGGFLQGRVNEFNHFAPPGNFQFNGRTTGSSMADFLLGITPLSFFQGLPNAYITRQNMMNMYFTDTWKVNSRLTINYGVRWEPYLPLQVKNGQISAFDMGRFKAGTRSQMFTKAPLGFYFPGDPGFPETSGANRQWHNFSPRIGLAFDPMGDGKMSIRASYAFSYVYVPGINREDQGGSNPWGGRATFSNPATFADPFASVPGGNPFPYTVDKNAPFTPRGQFFTNPYNLPALNSYSWNVAIQRQLGTTWVASATYIGSRIMRMYANDPINYGQLVNGPIVTTGCAPTAITCNAAANVDARRVLSLLNPAEGLYVGHMAQWDPSVTQRYNAMLLSLQKRFSHGISTSANWTWSHCTGYMQGFNSKQDQTVTAPGNVLFDRGDCDSDRRHIINFTAVAQAPRFSNNTLRMVASNWQLATIYKFTTGQTISVQSGADRSLTGINHQRPNLVSPDSVYGSNTPGGFFINKAAFVAQPLGTNGNLGWNSVVGPVYWTLDLALSRDFKMKERYTFQIRADAFNVTNSFVANPPSTATSSSAAPQATPAFAVITSPIFGQLVNAQPTRKLQFAMKFTF